MGVGGKIYRWVRLSEVAEVEMVGYYVWSLDGLIPFFSQACKLH